MTRPTAQSGGRLTLFGSASMRVLVLTAIGHKSGQRRDIALTYMRDENRLFVLGSNFGQAHHPAWSSNLLTNPDASVIIGGEVIPVTAALRPAMNGSVRWRASSSSRSTAGTDPAPTAR